MRYGMCRHNYIFSLIYLVVNSLKTVGVEQDGAEPTDMLQRALLHYEKEAVVGRICTLRHL